MVRCFLFLALTAAAFGQSADAVLTKTLIDEIRALRQNLESTTADLAAKNNRLDGLTTKVEADKVSLDKAKDALAVALSLIEEAETRA